MPLINMGKIPEENNGTHKEKGKQKRRNLKKKKNRKKLWKFGGKNLTNNNFKTK